MILKENEYEVDKIVPYRVHYVSGNQLIASNGLTVSCSEDGGDSWSRVCGIPRAPRKRLLGLGKMAARLLRADIHMIVPTSRGRLVVFAGRRVFSIDRATGEIESSCHLQGSRPLCVCATNDAIYYGEYRSNAERSPVSIWSSEDDGRSWQAVWTFTGIRHVHGVFEDPLDNSIWATTGDNDDESIVWRTTDHFSSMKPIISEGQNSRAVALLFTDSAILFGTDVPDGQNVIRYYDRQSGEITAVADSEGPVFFAAYVHGRAFLSTVVEPSDTNLSKDVVIYASEDRCSWVEALRLKKDWLPPKLFQYGQARFAAGPGDANGIWLTPLATTYDQQSLRLTWRDEVRSAFAR